MQTHASLGHHVFLLSVLVRGAGVTRTLLRLGVGGKHL